MRAAESAPAEDTFQPIPTAQNDWSAGGPRGPAPLLRGWMPVRPVRPRSHPQPGAPWPAAVPDPGPQRWRSAEAGCNRGGCAGSKAGTPAKRPDVWPWGPMLGARSLTWRAEGWQSWGRARRRSRVHSSCSKRTGAAGSARACGSSRKPVCAWRASRDPRRLSQRRGRGGAGATPGAGSMRCRSPESESRTSEMWSASSPFPPPSWAWVCRNSLGRPRQPPTPHQTHRNPNCPPCSGARAALSVPKRCWWLCVCVWPAPP
mmetsp:Transcript_28076/g.63597  ORF Transcript_28076/g.63597 Transcript_28076/m.63597 type:complete len:260 (-) Transcript_28076:662-1441(-)